MAVREPNIVIREEVEWLSESLTLSLKMRLGGCQGACHCIREEVEWLTKSLTLSFERLGGCQRASHCH